MDYAIKIVEQSGRELTDYQVKVEITDPDFFSKCTDQKFVEFYDEDKQTLLSHYTELFDPANNRAVFWVKVPSIPANGTKMIYLNVNTERTEDLSDPSKVFDFWDDFEAYNVGDFPTAKWTQGNAGWKIEQEDTNKIFAKKGTEDTAWARTNNKIELNAFALECKLKHLDTGYLTEIITHLPDGASSGDEGYMFVFGYNNKLEIYKQSSVVASKSFSAEANVWYKVRVIFNNGEIKLQVLEPVTDELTYSDTSPLSAGYAGVRCGSTATGAVDNFRVRKYTDPEPSVTVIKLGATPTYELKLKIAQALSGESDTILDTDPKLRLLSGTDIIKELSLTAKTVYKDSVNNRVVVAFLFVDDSSDEYTADNLELLFTKDNVEYVAFKSNKSFTKVADKRLPLRWEIYLNYDVDVCTYEESMVTCL